VVSVAEYLQRIEHSGLLSAEDVRAIRDQSPASANIDAVKAVASDLVRRGKLTKYQANAIWQGKHDALVMGNYVLLDVIGQGGMGTVYKAEHRRLKRTVAVKMLSPAAMKIADSVDRFHREMEAVGKLNHRNIVAAHDADEFRGQHFLVMEFVPGTDLDRLVSQQGPLSPETAAGCILQAARGLEYAHARGVLHRDIKPGNLLLATEGQQTVVKLLDLGLAWIRDSSAEAKGNPAERLTQNDRIMGTLDFMAPEQALDIHHADQRADIYSLGCSWYFLVTGRSIYPGDTVLKQLVAHREAAIPDLPGANERLNAVFRKMVAKVPEQRPQSMAEVIAALQECGITDAMAGGAVDLSGTGMPSPGGGESRPSISFTSELQSTTPAATVEPVNTASPRQPQRLVIAGIAAAVVLVMGVSAWLLSRGGSGSATAVAPPVVQANTGVPSLSNTVVSVQPAASSTTDSGTTTQNSQSAVSVAPSTTASVAPAILERAAAPDVTGEYRSTIAGEPWGLQVRRREDGTFGVRLMKGGLPGDGWDGQTVHSLSASGQDGKVVLGKNPRLAGTFEADQLVGTNAVGEPFTAQRVHRRSPTLEQAAPSGAIVLFDGGDVGRWVSGAQAVDGVLLPGALTKDTFRDFRLHLEYRLAAGAPPVVRCGVVLGCHEIALVDSFGEDATSASCAAIVGGVAPAVNASLPASQWQTLDIAFAAAKFDTSGAKTENARCTVRHNGIVVHDNVELRTVSAGVERPEPGPIALGTSAQSGFVFRNVWIEDLRPAAPVAVKPTWPEPNAGVKKRTRSAAGMIREEFALVQTLPLDEFAKVAEWFQEAGYRPVRLRPYTVQNGPAQVAALWQRDGHEWRLVTGTASDVQKQAEQLQSAGWWPVDVAGYAASGGEQYVALLARLPQKPAEEARIFPGVRQLALRSVPDDLPEQAFSKRVDHTFAVSRLVTFHSTLWWKTAEKSDGWYGDSAYYESHNKGFQLDVSLARAPLNGAPAYSWCALVEAPAGWESTELHGLAPEAHLRRCMELADKGYRPVAISAAHVNAPISLQGCSVWHRQNE